MSHYRVEAARDAATGKYRVTLYFPADSAQPFSTTTAIYDSEEEALAHVRRIMMEFSPETPER